MERNFEVKSNLPRQRDFVGRKDELNQIIDALSGSTRAWIISLVGVGGIGKSELAIQAAHICRNENLFRNIIWTSAKESWLTPHGIQQSVEYPLVSLDDLLNNLILVLELDSRLLQTNTQEKQENIYKALGRPNPPSLVIVDNLETISDPGIIKFLSNLPQDSKALVTTRLGGLGSMSANVAQSLTGQLEIKIGPLSATDAIDLFILRAKQHNMNYSKEKHFKILELAIEKTVGIPLAIEWVIGQMAIKGYKLDDALDMVQYEGSDVLEFCFNNLIQTVGERAKKVFLAISIFAKSASFEGLAALTQMKKEHLDESLRQLVKASLVELDDEGRYFLLPPTRLLSKALWQHIPDLRRIYYLHAATFYEQLLKKYRDRQQWVLARTEHHNMLDVFNWCFHNNQFETTLNLSDDLSEYLQRIANYDQRAYVCELATISAANLNMKAEEIKYSFELAEIQKHRDKFETALYEFQRCEKLSNEFGFKDWALRSRMQIGVVYFHINEFQKSISILQDCLDGFRQIKDESGESICQTLLGRNYLRLGKIPEAIENLEKGLQLKYKVGSTLDIAISQYDLGHAYHQLNDWGRAESLFSEAIERITGTGDIRHRANVMWYFALLKIDQGDFISAKKLLEDALLIYQELQRSMNVSEIKVKLAEIDEITTS